MMMPRDDGPNASVKVSKEMDPSTRSRRLTVTASCMVDLID